MIELILWYFTIKNRTTYKKIKLLLQIKLFLRDVLYDAASSGVKLCSFNIVLEEEGFSSIFCHAAVWKDEEKPSQFEFTV